MKIEIGDKEYNVEVARTEEEKIKGLQEKESLGEDEGMLFIYDEPQELAFWMKNTHIPLDLAYLNKDKIVISTHTMKPLDLTSIPSPSPAMYVIEMKQGAFEKYEIKIGSQFNF